MLGMSVHYFKAEVRQLTPVKKWPIYLKMQIQAAYSFGKSQACSFKGQIDKSVCSLPLPNRWFHWLIKWKKLGLN